MYSYSALSSLRCFVYFNLKRKMSFFLADEASLRFSSQYVLYLFAFQVTTNSITFEYHVFL